MGGCKRHFACSLRVILTLRQAGEVYSILSRDTMNGTVGPYLAGDNYDLTVAGLFLASQRSLRSSLRFYAAGRRGRYMVS